MATDIRTQEIEYPSSDGKPMADNTLQFQWIVTLVGGLDAAFRRDPMVFVAGDLLWYPVEGEPKICTAADAMVAFGRLKGHRQSYKQWEENDIAPQVVFEILSKNNSAREMWEKHEFYERYGVEEYYVYDPDRNRLRGWRAVDGVFKEILNMNSWVSPRLGIRFEIDEVTLRVYGPDGQRFLTFVELREQEERERLRATVAEDRATSAENRAHEAEKLAERLRIMLEKRGIDPNEANGN